MALEGKKKELEALKYKNKDDAGERAQILMDAVALKKLAV